MRDRMKITNGVAWHPAGLRVEVERSTVFRPRLLHVSDLNPENHIRFKLSRFDCFRLGLLLAWRSVFARKPKAS